MAMMLRVALAVLLHAACAQASSSFQVAESIPYGMEDLKLLPRQPTTADALTALIDSANESLRVTAMYWDLVVCNNPTYFNASVNTTQACPQNAGFTPAELDAMGVAEGGKVFAAFVRAVKRGVHLSILTALSDAAVSFDDDELDYLQKVASNGNVAVHPISMSFFFGTKQGDFHMPVKILQNTTISDRTPGSSFLAQSSERIFHFRKLICADRKRAYFGSANLDWLSMTQVKELGVIVHDPVIAADAADYFDLYFEYATLRPSQPPSSLATVVCHDRVGLVDRHVPCWSTCLPEARRCAPPAFLRAAPPAAGNLTAPIAVRFANDSSSSAPGSHAFVTCSPSELCAGGRTWDQTGMVAAIQTANRTLDLAVMDFFPGSLYRLHNSMASVFWPALTSAVLRVLNARKGVRVRLLVSQWFLTAPQQLTCLAGLLTAAEQCRQNNAGVCGSLAIKVFRVPGWQNTTAIGHRAYPGYSRVNHNKIVVTDTVVNLASSNYVWEYYYNTAGLSFQSDSPALRDAVHATFDRDWKSQYATPYSSG